MAAIVIQQERIFAEEAYVQTRRFIPGLQLRFGRFLSGIGYINRQHPHHWDFFDQALPYEALLGGGLADAGVQLTWLPALPVYTLFGFEAYRRTDVDRLPPPQMPLDDTGGRRSTQDGLYAQGVYGIAARWTAGGRFESIGLRNGLTIDGLRLDAGATTRSTANLTFNPTEFSRLRAQYSHMRLQWAGATEPVHQFSVQLQMSLGAHGAHRF